MTLGFAWPSLVWLAAGTGAATSPPSAIIATIAIAAFVLLELIENAMLWAPSMQPYCCC